MNPKSDSEIIEELRRKHGASPLIHLVRRLVVAIDQTDVGSQHRRQTNHLLSLLTQQSDLPPNSAIWLDWIEENESEVTWDSLGEMASEPLSKPLRKTVEIPKDDIPEGDRPRPMTKEQMIWDQALKRHERRGKVMVLKWLLRLLLVAGVVGGFLAYREARTRSQMEQGAVSQMDGVQQQVSRKNPSQQGHSDSSGRASRTPALAALSPLMFWGDHLPRHEPLKASLLGQALKSTPLDLPMELDWFRSPPTQGQTLAVDLVLQEMAYPHVPSAGSPGELDWRSLPEGKRQWKVDVESLGAQHRLIHEVEILQQGDRCEGIVRRRRGSDGVAHRFILKERGLVAWSWRMRWKDEVLEGQWVRYAQRGTAQIQLKLSGGVLWRQEVECPADLTLLPALEIPSLRAFEGYPKVMPLTGRICPPLNFPTSQVLENDGEYYRVMGLQGKWKERWTQVQLP